MSLAKVYAQALTVKKSDVTYYLNRFSKLFNWKPYKETILDVGCGDGFLTRRVLYPFVIDHAEKINAVDISPAVIEQAKNNNYIPEIEFNVMDMSQDDGVENMVNKFDHVFSFYCTHWILDQRSLLERFNKILKPNGQLFFSCLTNTPLHKTFDKFNKEEKWSNFFPRRTPFADYGENPIENMRKLLKQTGFYVNSSIRENKNGTIDGFEEIVKSIVSEHDFTNCIPEELREEYIQDFVKTSCEFSIPLESPDKYNLSYGSFAFIVTKIK